MHPDQAERMENETDKSSEPTFVKSACDNFDACLKTFNDVQCGGAPVAQEGVPM